MRAPPTTQQRIVMASAAAAVLTLQAVMRTTLCHLALLDEVDECEDRAALRRRQRELRWWKSWPRYIRPMLTAKSFDVYFRVDHLGFKALVDLLRERLESDKLRGERLRSRGMPVEYQVAMVIRWLAGGSVYEITKGHDISTVTADAIVQRVVTAINDCSELDCSWPEGHEELREGAERFRHKKGVMHGGCVGAIDRLFIRLPQSAVRKHPTAEQFFSAQENAHGLNFQGIVNAKYEVIAWAMNCPGSQKDCDAFKHSGFQDLLDKLPDHRYIVGDAAYPASDKLFTTQPKSLLRDPTHEMVNRSLLLCVATAEQALTGMARTWGILSRPIGVPLDRLNGVVDAIVRLQNFTIPRRSRR